LNLQGLIDHCRKGLKVGELRWCIPPLCGVQQHITVIFIWCMSNILECCHWSSINFSCCLSWHSLSGW
jgi:hypothetical protein